jgi:hypothetical protein
MSLSRTNIEKLTKEEWNELNALRLAINYNPHSVSTQKMELFTELFVRSIQGKGDSMPVCIKSINY